MAEEQRSALVENPSKRGLLRSVLDGANALVTGVNRETPPGSEAPARKMGRRGFIKLSAATAATVAAGTLVATGLNNRREIVAFAIPDLLKNPDLLNSLLETTANGLDVTVLKDKRDPQAPEATENLSYRPILSQITEAVDNYTQKGGNVTYTRNAGWRSDSYYIDGLHTVLKKSSIGEVGYDESPVDLFRDLGEFGGKNLFRELIELVPEGAGNILFYQEHGTPSSVKGSGLDDRVSQKTGIDLSIPYEGDEVSRDKVEKEMWTAAKEYFDEIQQFTEDAVRKNGNTPISSSVVLEFLLEKNIGALDKSILDLSIFLKYMARRNRLIGEFGSTVSPDEEWMATNILDEYGKVINYTSLSENRYPYEGHLPKSFYNPRRDQDLSRINQIGKPYHAWSIVAKLIAFPPSILKIGSIGRNWSTFSDQGLSKVSADLHVAMELDRIDKFLRNFES